MQFVLGLVSCGWYHPAGHSLHSLACSSRANLPLAHVRQSVVPSKLLLPRLQGMHFCVSALLPTQPAGQAWKPAQIPPVQLMRYEPGGTTTDAAPPPNAMELPDNSSQLTDLGFTCNHPWGQATHAVAATSMRAYLPGTHPTHAVDAFNSLAYPSGQSVQLVFPASS